MAKFLLPHELTAEHFDEYSDTPETGDLYYWLDTFFGMRPDDVLDGITIAIDEALSKDVGKPVVVNQERDNRGLMQLCRTPEELLGIWQEALGLSVQQVAAE